MSLKKRKPRKRTSPIKSASPIAEGELDVLKVLVKSTLANSQKDDKKLTEVTFGEIQINFIRHELLKNGKRLHANVREFQLLKYFLLHEGEVVSRDQLLTDVWGFEQAPSTRSVDNYILSLRKKIENDTARPRHILTLRGAGYKFIR